MRIVLAMLLVGCVSGQASSVAREALHSSPKHTHLMDSERIDGSDIYVFCRDEHTRDMGSVVPWNNGRSYDGACVTVVCEGDHCHV